RHLPPLLVLHPLIRSPQPRRPRLVPYTTLFRSPAEVSSMPVIRPAVTLPNPDVEARQMAPQVTEPETAPTEPVPTSVLAASDDTETVAPLREPPKPEQEAAYVQEKTAPHTRKFPALTTWRQAFQGLTDRTKAKS